MSGTARVEEFLRTVPIVTKILLTTNIAIHVLIFFTSFPVNELAINPLMIIIRGEFYRIFTSAFVHGGIMHIAMNMSSLLGIGALLEKQYGSIRMLFITLWALVLCGCMYTCLVWLYAHAIMDLRALNSPAVGYSGVLFCYALMESFHAHDVSRSVFGCFSVPTKVYPFILLVVIQVVMPNISWWGHLSGLLVGIVLISRPGVALLMPSHGYLEWLEQSWCCRALMQLSGYELLKEKDQVHGYFDQQCWCVPLPGGGSGSGTSSSSSGIVVTLYRCGQLLWDVVMYALYALRMVLNVIAVGLHAVGCPVAVVEDSCSRLGRCLHQVWAAWAATIYPSDTPSNNSNEDHIHYRFSNNGYRQLSQGEDRNGSIRTVTHGNQSSLPTTTTTTTTNSNNVDGHNTTTSPKLSEDESDGSILYV
mmetsp:Transcript_32077/g.54099  ORF Transcript_32077/g.54099 Transcript_32077/m.54099 type:complete len:419 (+) Transcript_32077:81-1337(+)